MDFDLAILGGGPAGLAAAWRAGAAGLQVGLFEPQVGSFDKPCGEGVLPSGLGVLAEMGIPAQAPDGRPFAGIRYHLRGQQPLPIDFPVPGCAYARPVLHRRMAECVAGLAGVMRIPTRAEVVALEEGYLVHTAGGSFTARHLIAADGAGGGALDALRRGYPTRGRQRLGCRARFENHGGVERVEVHVGAGFEMYLTPLPGRVLNVVTLAEARSGSAPSAGALLESGLAAHPEVAERLGAQVTAPEARRLGRPFPHAASDGNAFLAGDAGGAVDPILGAGLSIALQSGADAADAVILRLRGAAAPAVAAIYAAQARRQRASRRALANVLRFACRHEVVAGGMARVLRRMPGTARRLAAVAAGVPAITTRESLA